MNSCQENRKPIENKGEFGKYFDSETDFTCGCCAFHFDDVVLMHSHMRDHVEGGSYNYNHMIRTAFPVSLPKDASTQTCDSDASEENNERVSLTKPVKIKLLLQGFDDKHSGQNEGSSAVIDEELKAEISDVDAEDDYGLFENNDTQGNYRAPGELDTDGRQNAFKSFSTAIVPQQDSEYSNTIVIAVNGTDPTQHTQQNEVNVRQLRSSRKHVKTGFGKEHNKYNCDVKDDIKSEIEEVKDPHAKVECGICGKQVKRMNLRKHRRWVHERERIMDRGPVDCEQCGRSFPKLRNLVMHRKTHKGKHLICCHCNEQFSTHKKLIAHIKEHSSDKISETQENTISDDVVPPVSEKDLVFDGIENTTDKICKEESVQEFSEESVAHNSADKGQNYQPNHQTDNYLNSGDTNVNALNSGTGDAQVNDNTQVNDLNSGNTQVNDINSDDMKVNCELCGAVTKRKYLRRHCVRFHNEPMRQRGKKRLLVDTRHDKVECPLCGKVLKKMNLRKHHRKVHEKEKDTGPAICEVCGKISLNAQNLAKHKKVHTDKYLTCRQCGYLSSTHEEFQVHLKKHRVARTYPCNVCDMVFSLSAGLSKHMRRVHMGEKRYFCEICSKGFYSKEHLENHRAIHFEATLSCLYCDRKFKDPNSKKRHEKIHLGIHPYVCYICSHSFVQSGCYKSHMLKKHSVDNQRAMNIHKEQKAFPVTQIEKM